jgi:uncharacterized protein (TIGR03086 family)
VGDLADEAALSVRQLHRRCLANFGYGPSTLARILRFQRLLALAARHRWAAKADLASTAGYADQSHLGRDARALAGRPLTSVLARLADSSFALLSAPEASPTRLLSGPPAGCPIRSIPARRPSGNVEGMTDIADRFRRLSDRFEALVAAVPDDRWSSPSPCEGWDARDVVRHVVDVHGMMLKSIDRTLSAGPSVDRDPLGALQAARADVQAVLDDPATADTEYDGFFGRSKISATIDQFLGLDLVVHGWDLARATGQDDTMDPEEVTRLSEQVEGMGDMLRTPGVCGPAVAVPAGASAQDRMLGILGRDPRA